MKNLITWLNTLKFLIFYIFKVCFIYICIGFEVWNIFLLIFEGLSVTWLQYSYYNYLRREGYISFIKQFSLELTSKNGVYKGLLNLNIRRVKHFHIMKKPIQKLQSTLKKSLDFNAASDEFYDFLRISDINILKLIIDNSVDFRSSIIQTATAMYVKHDKEIINRIPLYEKYTESLILNVLGLIMIVVMKDLDLTFNESLSIIGITIVTVANTLIAMVVRYD